MTQTQSTRQGRGPIPTAKVLRGQQAALELVARGADQSDILDIIAKTAEEALAGAFAAVLVPHLRGINGVRIGGRGRASEALQSAMPRMMPAPALRGVESTGVPTLRLYTDDVMSSALWEPLRPVFRVLGLRAVWFEPVRSADGEGVIATLAVYLAEAGAPSGEEAEVLELLARLGSLVLERTKGDTAESIAAPVIDALTGLGNRQYLDLRGGEILRTCEQAGVPFCALHFILDQPVARDSNAAVKRLADADIKAFSGRMASYFHEARLLVRQAEADFIVLVPGELDDVRERIEALRSQIARPGHPGVAPMTFSCGLVQIDFQSDLESANSQADVAARRARSLGGDRTVVVDANESGMWLRRRLIEQLLADAIAGGDFVDPFMQPVVDLATGNPVGFEMLLRFKDQRLADMPLMECISVAEESGQIHAIGHQMLLQACQLLARRDEALEDKVINVNVSVRQLMRREFVEDVRHALAQYRVNPRQLCLEVTETHWLDADGTARETLGQCGSMGLKLALDDFGTGYASIAMLQSLPFGTLKVDRRFVSAINTDGNGKALCAALMAMAKACDIDVVAEGVENEAQARSLLALGYHKGQGFLWSRPMRMEVALRWLHRRELMRLADAQRPAQLAG
ncbi:MAG: hypothetical protein RL026_2702 [Pseudomonadota bacterium]|jgi:EAL domain-containing protein (putative c-di-GMP-specific phosphodiesterase class I)/GGDEF domain-containing protein